MLKVQLGGWEIYSGEAVSKQGQSPRLVKLSMIFHAVSQKTKFLLYGDRMCVQKAVKVELFRGKARDSGETWVARGKTTE